MYINADLPEPLCALIKMTSDGVLIVENGVIRAMSDVFRDIWEVRARDLVSSQHSEARCAEKILSGLMEPAYFLKVLNEQYHADCPQYRRYEFWLKENKKCVSHLQKATFMDKTYHVWMSRADEVVQYPCRDFASQLTVREHECYAHLIKGLSAKMIANKMQLSVRTVEKYIEVIKHKCGVNSKYELIQAR